MALELIVVLSLALALAVLMFSIILQFIREDHAHERQLIETVRTNRLLEEFIIQLRPWVPSAPHQSMRVPAYAAPGVDPHSVQDPALRRVVEVTRDDPPSSVPTIEVTGEEPLPRENVPLSWGRQRERIESPTLPSFHLQPAIGEDEDDTRILTRVGPPPMRKGAP